MPERRETDELELRLAQQAAIAELGRHALEGESFDELLAFAVATVTEQLGVPIVSIVQALSGGTNLVYRAGLDLDERADGELPDRSDGQIAHTLATAAPVVVEELGRERRFPAAKALSDAEVSGSSVSVPIGVGETRFGVLLAASRRTGDFSEGDVSFLVGLAKTIAVAAVRDQGDTVARTERRRLEDALEQASESEARFRELADNAPVLIWTANAEGVFDFINRGWLEFTGNSLDDELGDTWELGVHPDEKQAVSTTWWQAFERRVPWEREYRLRRNDGEYRWIVDRGVPRFVGGELAGYIGTATDIHERKEMERRLNVAYERDHEVAATLQRSLLPERLPDLEGVELEARYLPAAQGTAVGGDWYDAIELEESRVGIVVGDVVGHGLRAATAMGQLRNSFRAYALLESSPAQTLARMNRLLTLDGRDTMATALYLILDRDTGELTFCSAGHPPALVIATDGVSFLEGGRSVPLGTADPATYRDEVARLEPGSTLLLFTDGLVERRDTPLEDRLAQLATVGEIVDGDLSDVCDQVLEGVLGGQTPSDDVALLALRSTPTVATTLSLRLPADPSALGQIRRRVGRFLHAAGASDHERFEITLTASEAAMNAIEHAYGPGDAEFDLEAQVDGDRVTLVVRDSGNWRERRGTERGRGLSIIHSLMDEVQVEPGDAGTTVRMRRTLGSEAAVA